MNKLLFPLAIILMMANNVLSQGFIAASTYLGGATLEQEPIMTVVNGETYIVGMSSSANYPTTLGSPLVGGTNGDAVVTKLDANGNIIWSRFLGGDGNDFPNVIVVSGGSVYIGLSSSSSNFPVTNGSTPEAALMVHSVFVRLSANSGALQYSTYFGRGAAGDIEIVNGYVYYCGQRNIGGTLGAQLHIVKFDPANNSIVFDQKYGGTGSDGPTQEGSMFKIFGNEIYVLVNVNGPGFPVTDGSTYSGPYDHAYMKLDANDGTILFSTLFGGSDSSNWGTLGLELDNNGGVYLLGLTSAVDFPVTDGSTLKGGRDFYLRKYNSNNNALVYSKLLGSQSEENFAALKIEDGTVYVVGRLTSSIGYPHTVFPVASYSGPSHIFITKLNAGSGAVTYSSWIHSNGQELIRDFEVKGGDLYIVGSDISGIISNYPITDGSVRTTGLYNSLLFTKVNSVNQICFSTYLGGGGNGLARGLEVNNDMVYVLGLASNINDYPVTNLSSATGSWDFVWTKLNLDPVLNISPLSLTPGTQTACRNGLAVPVMATSIFFPSDSMPVLYKNGVPALQNPIEFKHQWQTSTSLGGPWTDIPGAVQDNYTPQVGLVDAYYRRVSSPSICSGATTTIVSSVASVLVDTFEAPTVTLGNVINTCAGFPTLLGGTPTAVANGGASLVSYLWSPGGLFTPDSTVANPTVTTGLSTIYTVRVTDDNGCQQIGQQLVNVYAANAGGNKSVCDGQQVRIGAAPIAGLPGVQYSWASSPGDTSMSCTNCAQPYVNPAVVTTYTLTLIVPITGGGVCSTTSTCVVTPIAAPLTANFAGADVTVCAGGTATLGTAPEAGFTYTWAPGNYLVSNNAAQVTFQPGNLSMPYPNPMTYFVTASKGGCSFVDQTVASVIEARAGDDGCGPRVVGQSDRTPSIGETYLWTKISGDGSIIGPNNLPQVQVSATSTGTTIYQLQVTYNGVTCTDIVEVPTCGCPVPSITVNAPNSCASYVLNNGTVSLTANNGLNSIYTWSPAAGLSSSTGSTVYLTDNISRTYTVTATSSIDPGFFCTNTIVVNDPAWSLPVFAAKDTVICPGTSVNIGQAWVAGYEYMWSGDTTLLSANNVSDPVATVNSTKYFPVRVTDVGSGCTTQDTASVTIVGLPAKVAGDNISLCGSATVVLGSEPQPNVNHLWTPATSYVPSNTSANPSVMVAVTTTFTVVATNTLTGCSVTDTIRVTVNPPVAPFSFTNQTFCPSIVGAIPLPAGPSGMTSYSWSPSSLVLNSNSNGPIATTKASRPQSTTNFVLTVTNAQGCKQAAQVTFTPSSTLPSSGGNKVICSGETVQLGGSSEVGASYAWSSNPASGNVFFSATNVSNPTFAPTVAGSYTLTVSKTDPGGCVTQSSAIVVVREVSLPSMSNPTVCQNACVTIGPATVIPGAQYFWTPTTGLSDPGSANPTACMGNSSMSYTLTVVSAEGCIATRNVMVGVNPVPAPTVSIPTLTPCLSDISVSLNPSVVPAGSYNYLWSPNNGTLNSIYDSNPTATLLGVGTQTYSLIVTDTATGCTSEAIAVINVQFCPEPIGTVGNYVWFDLNGNGLNDEPPSSGINDVVVQLYKETFPGSGDYLLCQTTTTANDTAGNPGYYLFSVTESGNYYIQFPLTTNGLNALTLQSPALGGDDNSDASTISGTTTVFAIDVLGNGILKDNPTLDAGYVSGFFVPIVELTATTAILLEDNSCEISWYTRDEYNTRNFEVERSGDGVNFKNVGSTMASGVTFGRKNYSFIDISNVADDSLTYYRIRLIDLDGKESLSNTVSIRGKAMPSDHVMIYPVPFDGHIIVEYDSDEMGDVVLELVDVSGRIITSKAVELQKGHLKIGLDGLSKLSSGVYTVQLRNLTTGEIFVRTVVK